MGNVGSKAPQPESLEATQLKSALSAEKLKSTEQQNLLRFKVEVMVNMLAMEEKKTETTTKRIEKLKCIMLDQGISEQRLMHMLENPDERRKRMEDSSNGVAPQSVDLSGSLSRTAAEFDRFRNDIVFSFASVDGKLANTLRTAEFSKQLYTVTEDLSKADIQVRQSLSCSSFMCFTITSIFARAYRVFLFLPLKTAPAPSPQLRAHSSELDCGATL